MNEHGIDVKMVTGNAYDVAAACRYASSGLAGDIVRGRWLEKDLAGVKSRFDSIAGFAEVLPKRQIRHRHFLTDSCRAGSLP